MRSFTNIILLASSFKHIFSFNVEKVASCKLFRKNGHVIQTFMNSAESNDEMSVSDLGLTMDDLNAPLPEGFLNDIQTTGYESTSRVETVQDNGCLWTESSDSIKVTLTIPGLRGQPAAALSTITSTNTLSITAFGRIVWSCILQGEVKPETAFFEVNDGTDMIPLIEFKVDKEEARKRWGGFILQIGEDSIL